MGRRWRSWWRPGERERREPSRPRLSCGRRVRSGLLRAKICVRAARYGESLWSWGGGFEVGRCGWLIGF